jgi:hypothetical protein
MIIETSLETGLTALVSALTYISANSIPVRGFSDNSGAEGIKLVMVHVPPVERIMPNYNYYKTDIEIICATHISDDKNRAIINAMYQACLGLVNGSGFKAALASASGLTINGVESSPEPGKEVQQGSYQYLGVNATIHITKT